jgi:hypothetical protein
LVFRAFSDGRASEMWFCVINLETWFQAQSYITHFSFHLHPCLFVCCRSHMTTGAICLLGPVCSVGSQFISIFLSKGWSPHEGSLRHPFTLLCYILDQSNSEVSVCHFCTTRRDENETFQDCQDQKVKE